MLVSGGSRAELGLGAAEEARLVSVLTLHLGRLAIAQVAGDKGSSRGRTNIHAEAAGGSVSRYWRQEWEQLYPGLNIDWKQVVSRYHYHFGAERRDSADGEITS